MASASISALQRLCLLLFIILPSFGDQINITSVIGENLILPCRAENRPIRFVEWRRTDIEKENVLRYRNDEVDRDNQHPSFKDRVIFQDREMKNGDVSLVLINVRTDDSGTYEAEVSYHGTGRDEKLISTIHLHVAPPPPESFPSWAIALLVLLVLIPIGFLFYRRYSSKSDKEQVEVVNGEKSVLLPCRTRDNMPGDVGVLWMDNRYRKVHVFENGSDQPKEQDQFYRNRTKMNKDLLRAGDLSLTLRDPTDEDSGIFVCIITSNEGDVWMVKRVQLKVQGIV